MNSSIVFRNLTCLDFAYIDQKGLIHGNSFHISATVSGDITDDESVVIDFSKGKKIIKEIIDDKDCGFDHKILLFKDSKYELTNAKNNILLISPFINFSLPKNTIHEINVDYSRLNEYMSTFITKNLCNLGFNITCKISVSQKGFDNFGDYFSYFHSLPCSSSYGCQQPHGHYSFVEVNDLDLQNKISKYLDDIIFINSDTVISETLNSINYRYETERGSFDCTFFKPHKWIIFDGHYSTIELIVNHVKEKFKRELENTPLFISEGLQKGSCI